MSHPVRDRAVPAAPACHVGERKANHDGGERNRVVVIAPAISQPRHHRRVSAFLAKGCDVSVYSFTRGYYEVNQYPHEVDLHDLGPMPFKKNVRRLAHIARAIARVRRQEVGKRPALIYAFGLEAALIGLSLRTGQGLVYEVGDLRAHRFSKRLKDRAICWLERAVLRRTRVTVVTSKGFLPHFERQTGVGSDPLVIENRLPSEVVRLDPQRPSPARPGDRIRIGFIGFLRYESSFNALLAAVAVRPDRFVLDIHGDGPLREKVASWASGHPNIHYHGPFRNPEDLGRIYRSLDLNFVVYNNVYYNVRVAVPNKLFESLYYGIPIVAASTTALAEEVERTGAGFVVDPQEAGYFDRFLDELKAEDITLASSRALDVPLPSLLLDQEPLLDRLDALMPFAAP